MVSKVLCFATWKTATPNLNVQCFTLGSVASTFPAKKLLIWVTIRWLEVCGAFSVDPVKPPLPVHVVDLRSFARLALALTDGSQILWHLNFKGKEILALFTAYMYWSGDLPILAYVNVDSTTKPFLAYKSDSMKGEEWCFTDDVDDTRFKYASLVEVKDVPKAFSESLSGEFPTPSEPMLCQVQNVNSLARILLPLSIREGTVFPLWHFARGKKHIIGTCIPFEHYYEADALPVFFYIEQENSPDAAFIKYIASKPHGEKIEYTNNTSDAKFFYAKVVGVKDLPIFP